MEEDGVVVVVDVDQVDLILWHVVGVGYMAIGP